MAGSDDSEKRRDWVLDNCICMSCPTWVDCGEQGGFCIDEIGKSRCIEVEKGCICGGCVVLEKLELRHLYFCNRGSEKVQSSQ